jgi:ribose transport system permease protein
MAEAPVIFWRYGMVVVLVVMIIVTAAVDKNFATQANLLNLLLQWAPQGLMAIGMTYVIIAGGFDLSVGGTYVAGGVIFAALALHNNTWLALLLALLAGGGIGAINGIVITRLDVNPFVATLGAGFMITGIAEVASNATPIILSKTDFTSLGTSKLGAIPTPGILLVVAMIVGGIVLSKSVYGRSIYAIGGGDEPSRLAGLRTKTLRASTYVLTGVGAALAGAIIASRLGSAEADIGTNVELEVITIVVIGGTALGGGEGAMWRTAVGVAILAVIGNAFDHLQVNTFYREVIEGAIIILAIAIDSYGRKRSQHEVRLTAWRLRRAGMPESEVSGTATVGTEFAREEGVEPLIRRDH